MNGRRRQLAQLSADFLEWIWLDCDAGGPGFVEWLMNTEPVYWISGKPGSGKTTLMKYLSENRRVKRFLSGGSAGSWLCLHFYFDFRAGSETANTLERLLRTLLLQLIQSSRMAAHAIARDEEGERMDFRSTDLNLDELRLLFQRGITAAGKSHCICCFIDGLDDYASDYHHLVHMVENLQKAGIQKICLASRPENILFQYFEQKPFFRMHQWNEPTVREYADHTITRLPDYVCEINVTRLIDAIVSRAQGVILWASLVTSRLVTGLLEGQSEADIYLQLSEFPEELDDLYARLLTKKDQSLEVETALLLCLLRLTTAAGPQEGTLRRHNSLWYLHRAVAFAAELFGLPKQPATPKSFLLRLRARLGSMIDITTSSYRKQAFHRAGVSAQEDHPVTLRTHIRLFHLTLDEYLRRSNWIEQKLDEYLKGQQPIYEQWKALKSHMILPFLSLQCVRRYEASPSDCQRLRWSLSTEMQSRDPGQQQKDKAQAASVIAIENAFRHRFLVTSGASFLSWILVECGEFAKHGKSQDRSPNVAIFLQLLRSPLLALHARSTKLHSHYHEKAQGLWYADVLMDKGDSYEARYLASFLHLLAEHKDPRLTGEAPCLEEHLLERCMCADFHVQVANQYAGLNGDERAFLFTAAHDNYDLAFHMLKDPQHMPSAPFSRHVIDIMTSPDDDGRLKLHLLISASQNCKWTHYSFVTWLTMVLRHADTRHAAILLWYGADRDNDIPSNMLNGLFLNMLDSLCHACRLSHTNLPRWIMVQAVPEAPNQGNLLYAWVVRCLAEMNSCGGSTDYTGSDLLQLLRRGLSMNESCCELGPPLHVLLKLVQPAEWPFRVVRDHLKRVMQMMFSNDASPDVHGPHGTAWDVARQRIHVLKSETRQETMDESQFRSRKLLLGVLTFALQTMKKITLKSNDTFQQTNSP